VSLTAASNDWRRISTCSKDLKLLDGTTHPRVSSDFATRFHGRGRTKASLLMVTQ
jgi:hypothetical protein